MLTDKIIITRERIVTHSGHFQRCGGFEYNG